MKKIMKVIIGDNTRDIVNQVNDKGISKDDIVTLFKEEGQFILIYYA